MDIQLLPEVEAKVNRLASAQGRAPSDVVSEAVERVVDYDAWFVRSVEHAIAQADAGDLIPHEEVVARIESILQKKL